jgi:hypothetical protein
LKVWRSLVRKPVVRHADKRSPSLREFSKWQS